MLDKIIIKVQWPNGSMLPVFTNKTSNVSELSYLLRFACSPHQEVILIFNGTILDPSISLENQMVKENDILKAVIVPKAKRDEKKLNTKIKQIILEAAKVSDRQMMSLENENYRYKQKIESSSDDDYVFFDFKYEDKKKSISKDPLPPFWNDQNANPRPPDLLGTNNQIDFSSVEEAGKFFENKGWSSWVW